MYSYRNKLKHNFVTIQLCKKRYIRFIIFTATPYIFSKRKLRMIKHT